MTSTITSRRVSTTCSKPGQAVRFIACSFGSENSRANREHQENDAELGQIFHPVNVRHQVQRMRPDDAANRQVTKHRRQIETTKEDHGENRGPEQDEDGEECAQSGPLEVGYTAAIITSASP